MTKKITVVRLVDAIHVGKSMDANRSLENGGKVDGVPITLEFYDDVFMLIRFKGAKKDQQYCQLVPWAAVESVYFEETK